MNPIQPQINLSLNPEPSSPNDFQSLDLPTMPLSGRILIEASAGTGKTYTLCSLVLRLIMERALPLEQILIVTFTEAATADLKQRLGQLFQSALAIVSPTEQAERSQAKTDPTLAQICLQAPPEGRARLEQALLDLPEAQISTLHGFCQHLLKRWPFLAQAPLQAKILEEIDPLLEEIAQDVWRRFVLSQSPQSLEYLIQTQGLNLSDLQRLVRDQLDLPVEWVHYLPNAPDDLPSEAPDFDQITELWQIARSLYHSDLDSIKTGLEAAVASGQLNGRQYQARFMKGIWQAAQQAFGSPFFSFELDPKVQKCSQAFLLSHTKAGKICPEHAFFGAIDDLWLAWSAVKDWGELAALQLRHQLIGEIRSEFEQAKTQQQGFSFDDLLQKSWQALANPLLVQAVQAQYPVALIDEYQDTDPIQNQIFQILFPEQSSLSPAADQARCLILIGDPKQSIYRFRGADIFTYQGATRAPDMQRFTLNQNWRTTPAYLKALARIFDQRPDLFQAGHAGLPALQYHALSSGLRPEPAKADKGLRYQGQLSPALHLLSCPQADLRAQAASQWVQTHVCQQILALLADSHWRLDGQRIEAQDITILTRTHRQSREIELALTERGVPVQCNQKIDLLDSLEAWELGLILQALVEPGQPAYLRRALGTQILAWQSTDLLDPLALGLQTKRWASYRQLWEQKGFGAAWLRFSQDHDWRQILLAQPQGSQRCWRLQSLIDQLLVAQSEHAQPADLLRWYQRCQDGELPWPSDLAQTQVSTRNAVQIMTIHRSKGLEFKLVFCPWLWNDQGPQPRFLSAHDPETGGREALVLNLTGKEKTSHPVYQRYLAEEQSERLRLAYVALTRASQSCWVYWVWQNTNYRSTTCRWSSLGYLLGLAEQSFADETMHQQLESFRADGVIAHLSLPISDPPGIYAEAFPPVLHETQSTNQPETLPTLASGVMGRKFAVSRRLLSFSQIKRQRSLQSASQSLLDGLLRQDIERENDLPAGSEIGQFFHYLLENLSFDSSPEQIQEQIQTELKYAPELAAIPEAEGLIQTLISNLLSCPLHPELTGLRLDQISSAESLLEAPFSLQLPQTPVDKINQLLRAYGYADLPGRQWLGFLKGSIDLVFSWQGQTYLLDYKSNRLDAGYEQAALQAAMTEHQYDLQALLYALAWQRHLQQRPPGPDGALKLAGVFYLFLRGIPSPEAANEFIQTGWVPGVHFQTVPHDLLAELDQLLRVSD